MSFRCIGCAIAGTMKKVVCIVPIAEMNRRGDAIAPFAMNIRKMIFMGNTIFNLKKIIHGYLFISRTIYIMDT